MLKRSVGYHGAQFELFWSYKKWFAGDTDLGNEIMANIAMFVPFGFLMSTVLSPSKRKVRTVAVIVSAAVFSLIIETLQLFLMRGLFEWDDLFSNVCGAAAGVVLYWIVETLLKKHFQIVTASIGIAFSVVCLAVYIIGPGGAGVEADTTSRIYCFQIDDAAVSDGVLTLTGFTFRYEHPADKISLVLRSADGKDVKMATTCGIERTDVNEYFLCDDDYTASGFTAAGKVDDSEYEILVRWPWSIALPTGVFVSPGGVHYVPEKEFAEPSITADFVKYGTLRVYRPDYHCWVYQYDGALYWIADQDFHFEEDGTTYIQYQIWTTQIQNLPEKRLARNNFWDNIGGFFEAYELEGDFGKYRVSRRELPTAYSVTSILTGYYKNGEWIWKNYFRPIYAFGNRNR